MTYREKFQLEHPDSNVGLIHIFRCPQDPKTGQTVNCPEHINGSAACRVCWDREVPDEKES